jgi:hypothetical protein
MAHSHGYIPPCSQLILHFSDYQRSSPLYRQLICQASHSNCSPSPSSRFSLPQTTTGTPPAYRSSGPHSLAISIDLPQSTCRTQTYWLGCRSQSLPLLSASRYRRHGLVMFSPWHPACWHTCTAGFWEQTPTCRLLPSVYHLISRVGGGDISTHRHGLIGSCSSTFQYSA